MSSFSEWILQIILNQTVKTPGARKWFWKCPVVQRIAESLNPKLYSFVKLFEREKVIFKYSWINLKSSLDKYLQHLQIRKYYITSPPKLRNVKVFTKLFQYFSSNLLSPLTQYQWVSKLHSIPPPLPWPHCISICEIPFSPFDSLTHRQ